MSQEFPPVFDTSVKLEQTAKGNRASLHVYGNGRNATIDELIKAYKYLKEKCEKNDIPLAVMEVQEK